MTEHLTRTLERNETTNAWIRRLVALAVVEVMIFVMLMGIGIFWTVSEARDQSRKNFEVIVQTKATADQVAATLQVVLADTGCDVTDTVDMCAERVRAKTLAEGARRIAEVDCLTRRALAGMAAPDPTKSCLPQTPADIYPDR
ncbi:MAG TPA: hypothetical protein VMZ51_08115 [Acidimicrobiales bacterium]|nr:hypothetical protein [Acidimicrobiales bacterium]